MWQTDADAWRHQDIVQDACQRNLAKVSEFHLLRCVEIQVERQSAMGKSRLDRKTVRLSAATIAPKSTKKKRMKQRGLKTRIIGFVQSLKEFLLADSYMYGPVADSPEGAAIQQRPEEPVVSFRDRAQWKQDVRRSDGVPFDRDTAAGLRYLNQENSKRIKNLGDMSRGLQKSRDGGAEDGDAGREIPKLLEACPAATPASPDVLFLKNLPAHDIEKDEIRREPVRVRLHRVTRTATTHTTFLPAKQPVKPDNVGAAATAVESTQEPHDQDGDVKADDDDDDHEEAETEETEDSMQESMDEPGSTEESDCSLGGEKANYAFLSTDEAAKVAQQLVDKFGGRYSAELGIDVDKSDREVERWFLASVLFNHRATFEPSPEVLQKLREGGVQTMADVADRREADLAALWEGLGDLERYNRRSAARFHKLARQLRSDHGGNISSMKCITNQDELHEAVSKLYAVGPSTANAFLRELRGTWPGANPELGTRSLSALRHLRMVDPSDNPPYAVVWSCLGHVANDSAVDFRDLEVALIRFGHCHARNYRKCQGGLECETWTSIPPCTSQRHYKYEC